MKQKFKKSSFMGGIYDFSVAGVMNNLQNEIVMDLSDRVGGMYVSREPSTYMFTMFRNADKRNKFLEYVNSLISIKGFYSFPTNK